MRLCNLQGLFLFRALDFVLLFNIFEKELYLIYHEKTYTALRFHFFFDIDFYFSNELERRTGKTAVFNGAPKLGFSS